MAGTIHASHQDPDADTADSDCQNDIRDPESLMFQSYCPLLSQGFESTVQFLQTSAD